MNIYSYLLSKLLMTELRNTVIEENFPAIRRRSLTTLDNLIKHTIAESFITYIQDVKNRKPSLKQSEQAISSHFKKIHGIIDTVDDHIARRLENHETQVFSLVKGQIEEMRQETRRIVQKLNDAIAKKNTEDQIWRLSNQLDYFKSQTFKLFNENKKLREEIVNLKKNMKESEVQLENSDALMQKLRRKFIKQNFIKEKLLQFIRQKISSKNLQEITLQKISMIAKIAEKQKWKIKYKTQQSQNITKKNSTFLQSKVNIELKNATMRPHSQFIFNEDKITQQFSMPNSILDDIDGSEFPQVRMQKIDSYIMNQVQKNMVTSTFRKTDKGIQTQQSKISRQNINSKSPPIKNFSNTSYIDLKNQQNIKKSQLPRNGLFARSYNQNIGRADTKNESYRKSNNQRKQSRHMRYMSNAFNKNKMFAGTNQVRGGVNKSSLK